MAKQKDQKKDQKDQKPKRNKSVTTLAYKARNVLQSNGLYHFRVWAEKSTKQHGSFKVEQPTLYRELIAKGERMGRKMDQGKKPKSRPSG